MSFIKALSSIGTLALAQTVYGLHVTRSTALRAPSLSSRPFTTASSRLATYGFIGLGRMGSLMAQNLRAKLSSSDTLVIFDANPSATAKFVKHTSGNAKVEIASSAKDLAVKSSIVITALPDPSHVKTLFYSILDPPLPPLAGATSTGRLFIDCSTIDPTSSRLVANAVHTTKQGLFVDAPMSGGVVGAEAGTLTFMLGAHEKYVAEGLIEDRVRPILSLMGKQVLHLGGQGAGLAAKLANNYLLAITNIATAEAMNLGIRCGLDPKALANLINISTGQCWSSMVNNPVKGVSSGAPSSADYKGGFSIELMQKDLSLAMIEGERVAARTALGDLATGIYQKVKVAEPGRDFSVVYKWLNETGLSSREGKGKNTRANESAVSKLWNNDQDC